MSLVHALPIHTPLAEGPRVPAHMVLWTVMNDYGGFQPPLVWARSWHSEEFPFHENVGLVHLFSDNISSVVPAALAARWARWADAFEKDTHQHQLDWDAHHQEGLCLTAQLALWCASSDVVVRYSFPFEDPERQAYPCVYMTPEYVRHIATECQSDEQLQQYIHDDHYLALDRLWASSPALRFFHPAL